MGFHEVPLYVMFTSGSSGTPKAVLGSAHATLRRLEWMWGEVPFEACSGGGARDVVMFRTPVSFVDCWWEALGGLLAGVPTLVRRLLYGASLQFL